MFPPPPLSEPRLPSTGSRWRGHLRAWADRSPWHFATVVTAGAFVVASCLPIWQSVWFGDWEITGELSTFWMMVVALMHSLRRGTVGTVVRFQGWNATVLAVLLVVSLGVGYRLGRRAGSGLEPRRGVGV